MVHGSDYGGVYEDPVVDEPLIKKALPYPSFQELVSGQSVTGAWKNDDILSKYFVEGTPDRDDKFEVTESQWYTLLAMQVMDEKFQHKKTLSKQIRRKAKAWLIRQKVKFSYIRANMKDYAKN